MSIFRSIKTRLLIFGLSISLIPISIITTIYYFNTRRALKSHQLQEMTAIAESKKFHTIDFIKAKEGRTIDFSSDGFIRDSLEAIARKGYQSHAVTNLNKHLKDSKMPLDPQIVAIAIVGLDGRIVSSTNEAIIGKNMSKYEIFNKGVDKNYGETYVGQSYHSPYVNTDCIIISAPITRKNGGGTIGVIINYYDLDALSEITTNRAGMGETGEVYLVNNSDKIMLTKSRFIEDAKLKQVVDTAPVRKIVEHGEEMSGIYADYRGVPIVGASAHIPEYGWTLLAEVDKAEAFAHLRGLSITALIVGGVCGAASICVGIIFSLSTARPINKLKCATERIASGNLKYRVDINSNNEIGSLANSFNTMAGKLNLLTESLEKRIDDRTAELAEKNEKMLEEIIERKRVEDELKVLNESLERRVEERTKKLVEKSEKLMSEIVKRGLAEETLRESEEKYRGIFERVPVSIILLDRNGQIIDVNPYHVSHIGKGKTTREDYVGKNVLTHPSIVNAGVSGIYADVLKGKPFDLKEVFFPTTTGGTAAYLNVKGVPLLKDGDVIGALTMHEDVTECKRMEFALKESEERYRQIVSTTRDAIMVFDAKTRQFIEVNKACEELYGYSREEFFNMRHSDITNEPEATDESIFKIIAGEPQKISLRYHRKKDGTIFPVEISASAFTYKDQNVLCGIIRDITERERMESELIKSEKRYASISKLTSDYVYHISISPDRQMTVDWITEGFTKITGYTLDDIVRPDKWEKIVHPDDDSNNKSKLESIMLGNNEEYECRIITKKAETLWLHVYGQAEWDAKKQDVIGIIGAVSNITERKQAEVAMHDGEERLKAFLENSALIGWMKDEHGKHIFLSNNYQRVIGCKFEDWKGKTDFELWPQEIAEQFRKNDLKVLAEGNTIEAVEMALLPDGSQSWWLNSKFLFVDSGGRKYVGGLGVDITERKKAEEHQRRLALVVKDSNDAIMVQDLEGNIISWNIGAERMYGWNEDEAFKMNIRDIIPEEKRKEALDIVKKAEAAAAAEEEEEEEIPSFETQRVTKDGRILDVWMTVTKLVDDAGKITSVATTERDITKRKRAEEQIKTSLKEKEVLLNEVHHRVKNNLQIISSLLDMSSMQTRNQEAIELFRDSRNRVDSMALIHSQLYKSERLNQIDMEKHIQELSKRLLQIYEMEKTITLDIKSADISLPITRAVPCALVLNELISNTLKHAYRAGQKGKIDISIQRSDGDTFSIKVKDDGIGIPEEIDIDKTNSLGLSLVRNLVFRQLSGKLYIRRNGGTEVVIEFKALKKEEIKREQSDASRR